MKAPPFGDVRCGEVEGRFKVRNCRIHARCGHATKWQNVRHDVSAQPDVAAEVPESAWFDQALCGSRLVPVLSWPDGDGLFLAWPLAGEWPQADHDSSERVRLARSLGAEAGGTSGR